MPSIQDVRRAFIELFIVWLMLLFVAHPVHAHTTGARLAVNPATVCPTQGVVGYDWVAKKTEKFSEMSVKELDRQLADDPAPAVLGADGCIYILDNHHEFYSLIELGVTNAYVEIVADFSRSQDYFEEQMLKRRWFYFGDEHGDMTFTIANMPRHVAQLRNDPYRSLAGFLRKAGGFAKDHEPKSEFAWVAALRRVVTMRLILEDFDEALNQALEFAESRAARGLPGYISKKNRGCEDVLKSKKKVW